VAGAWYLLLGLTAPLGLEIVPDRLYVAGNATETAARVLASETLYRLGMASELFHQVVVIFLALALFRLFRHMNETLAWQVVILGALVSVPIMFLNVVNEIAALTLFKGGGFLGGFEKPELDALGYLFIRMHGQGIHMAAIFWGLWLFPFGLLVIRCGFIPRIIGYSLFVAGAAYVAAAVADVLLPQLAPAVFNYAGLLEICELPIIFWLVIAGATGPKAQEAV
jgi:hypothetical protein